MNCDKAQENVFEYLDGSLSPSDRAALRAHVEKCAKCREIIECEVNLARGISLRMESEVVNAQLEPHTKRSIVAVAAKTLSPSRRSFFGLIRLRFALGVAAAAIVVSMLAVAHHQPVSQIHQQLQVGRVSVTRTVPEISVKLNYCEPTYIFHWKGNTVVDAIVCERRVTEASLIVKN